MKAIYRVGADSPECAHTPYTCRVETEYENGKNVIRIILDDGRKFSYSSVRNLTREWILISYDDDPVNICPLKDRDERLEALWDMLEDIPMNPETECIERDFLHFSAGTHREEIWHWFDERYSRGVHALLYGGAVCTKRRE